MIHLYSSSIVVDTLVDICMGSQVIGGQWRD
jgi:hypothetical protein